ncbi:MAG: aspartate--tRNA ligase [Oscillospiraceae bacterium]|nr:aspartate--tRNA ligase [Oscillospiraceae bacterium]
MQSRTHTCGELRMEHVGQKVQLAGWMENVREVGGSLAFVVVRDFYGKTQLVVENEDLLRQLKGINKESTIGVIGTVRERASKNPNIPTGDIEVVPEKITVLGRCRYNELPFEINRSREADEAQRLKYRYLDLRNPAVKQNIILRCQVIAAIRKAMLEHDFLEITTPILTASSPEGARDYLVPARKHPGKFYALPQAPQQFKQLLMTSGFDRYFQIAPCFRDEDARGDRSPGEFYQLDMEMAFASQEDVFAILEDVLPPIFAKYGKYDIASEAPFRRIKYVDALETYGSDKPDLRIDLVAQDITDLLKDTEFQAFQNGNTVKAIVVSGCELTRKQIDKLCTDVEVQAGAKPYWFRMDESGAIVGGVAKFVDPLKDVLTERLGLKPGCLVGVTTGVRGQAQKTAGVMIKMLGALVPGHMDKERYEFCWIVDFPMYEIGEESGELEFCHNPFSMPAGGLDILLKAERGEVDPLTITADQYDLVCNGVELSSGAVRNHDPEIMIKAFEMVRLGEEDVKKKFPAMYNAFCYGAPPHAGIAPGIDRMVMLLAGEDSIREIIPFPMNKSAQDVMMGAPSTVEQKQLDELHIAITCEPEA